MEGFEIVVLCWVSFLNPTYRLRECRIESDWLLIYRIEGSELCLIRTDALVDSSLTPLNPPYDLRDGEEKIIRTVCRVD